MRLCKYRLLFTFCQNRGFDMETAHNKQKDKKCEWSSCTNAKAALCTDWRRFSTSQLRNSVWFWESIRNTISKSQYSLISIRSRRWVYKWLVLIYCSVGKQKLSSSLAFKTRWPANFETCFCEYKNNQKKLICCSYLKIRRCMDTNSFSSSIPNFSHS